MKCDRNRINLLHITHSNFSLSWFFVKKKTEKRKREGGRETEH